LAPLNTLPGYDPLMQAFSGIMNVTGEEGQAPVRADVSIVDFGSGMWAVIGILAALFRRQATGRGATVNGSLLETAVAWMTVGVANYAADGDKGGRHGSGIGFIVPHRAYTAADGHLVVSCANDRLFAVLCEALDRPEWVADPKFATNAARLENRVEIDCLIGDRLSTQTRAFWQQRLHRHGVACAPIQDVAELCAHEQTGALGILGKPAEDEIALVGLPLSFDGRRPPALTSAPALGQHDDHLRKLLGSRTHP
jgi:crotonobetainyl-CoA:carnitine CoA-transferase CaiB-like acyl-CoA transferase